MQASEQPIKVNGLRVQVPPGRTLPTVVAERVEQRAVEVGGVAGDGGRPFTPPRKLLCSANAVPGVWDRSSKQNAVWPGVTR